MIDSQNSLRVEPAQDETAAGCPCCEGGGLRGFVFENETPHSVYFVESGGMANKPVILIGIVTGRWASDADISERVGLVFACSQSGDGADIRPTIPALLAFPEFRTLGKGIEPEQAQGHTSFALLRRTLDAIIAQDARLAHLRADPGQRRPRFVVD
jgi:hypothetical protein